MMQMIEEQKGAFSAGKAFSSDLTKISKTVFDRVRNTQKITSESHRRKRMQNKW